MRAALLSPPCPSLLHRGHSWCSWDAGAVPVLGIWGHSERGCSWQRWLREKPGSAVARFVPALSHPSHLLGNKSEQTLRIALAALGTEVQPLSPQQRPPSLSQLIPAKGRAARAGESRIPHPTAHIPILPAGRNASSAPKYQRVKTELMGAGKSADLCGF